VRGLLPKKQAQLMVEMLLPQKALLAVSYLTIVCTIALCGCVLGGTGKRRDRDEIVLHCQLCQNLCMAATTGRTDAPQTSGAENNGVRLLKKGHTHRPRHPLRACNAHRTAPAADLLAAL
jgi:hypothetical protein